MKAIFKAKPYCLFPRTPQLFSSLNVQKTMLEDTQRIDKFRKSIFKNVKKGDIVIDLGTGTGILAIFAAQAGAKKVYAIEESDVADVASSIIKYNGYSNVITVIKANSNTVILPEKADVLIAELIGHYVLEEGIVEYICDVRMNLLKPRAKIIPRKCNLFFAPIELTPSFDEVAYWRTWKNPDLSIISNWAANTIYVESIDANSLLTAPIQVLHIDFLTDKPKKHLLPFSFKVTKSGVFGGFAGWFDLFLDQKITIKTNPKYTPTHWKQVILPLSNPIKLQYGDKINGYLEIEKYGPGAKWKWNMTAKSGRKYHREIHEFHVTYGDNFRLLVERF